MTTKLRKPILKSKLTDQEKYLIRLQFRILREWEPADEEEYYEREHAITDFEKRWNCAASCIR